MVISYGEVIHFGEDLDLILDHRRSGQDEIFCFTSGESLNVLCVRIAFLLILLTHGDNCLVLCAFVLHDTTGFSGDF